MSTTNEKIKEELRKTKEKVKHPDQQQKETCPCCGRETLIHESGCVRCYNCGWGKCE